MFQIPLSFQLLKFACYLQMQIFLTPSPPSQSPPTLHVLHQVILMSLLPSVHCITGTYQAVILIDIILGERIKVSEMRKHKKTT